MVLRQIGTQCQNPFLWSYTKMNSKQTADLNVTAKTINLPKENRSKSLIREEGKAFSDVTLKAWVGIKKSQPVCLPMQTWSLWGPLLPQRRMSGWGLGVRWGAEAFPAKQGTCWHLPKEAVQLHCLHYGFLLSGIVPAASVLQASSCGHVKSMWAVLCVCMGGGCVSMRVHTWVCLCARAHMGVCVCVCVCMGGCVCVCVHGRGVCVCVHVHTWVLCVFVCAWASVCVHGCVCVCTHGCVCAWAGCVCLCVHGQVGVCVHAWAGVCVFVCAWAGCVCVCMGGCVCMGRCMCVCVWAGVCVCLLIMVRTRKDNVRWVTPRLRTNMPSV